MERNGTKGHEGLCHGGKVIPPTSELDAPKLPRFQNKLQLRSLESWPGSEHNASVRQPT
jgi:hypothetical protein